jgi:hypothetical protein
MNLNNALTNLRKTKDSFFNIGEEIVDSDLMKKDLKVKFHIKHYGQNFSNDTFILKNIMFANNNYGYSEGNKYYFFISYIVNVWVHIPINIDNYSFYFGNRYYLLKLVK